MTIKPINLSPAIVHLYPGASFHLNGTIVGNKHGLEQLRDAINQALTGDTDHNVAVTIDSKDGIFTADGEGYQILVIRHDKHWQHAEWQSLILPYTAEDGVSQNATMHLVIDPEELLTEEDCERVKFTGPYTVSECGSYHDD